MRIVKQLRINGAEEVNAVLINDEGEEYPVFLESLHNTVIFPMLIESGYKLATMPYGFVVDGVSMQNLPIEDYTAQDSELELMYNSIGVKEEYDKIKSYLDAHEAVGRPTPPTQYTIHTREELIQYLLLLESAELDEDFKPLNYFVDPVAMFTIKEYIDVKNKRYIDIITNRRAMTIKKFHTLVHWLHDIGVLSPNYTAMDVIDAYFAWGIDGLRCTIVAAQHDEQAYRLMVNNSVKVPMLRKTQGFVDGQGNLLTPLDESDVVWKVDSSAPDYVKSITDGMSLNETKVITYKSNIKQTVTTLDCVEFKIQYTTEYVIILGNTYHSLAVKSLHAVGEFVELNKALPRNTDKLYDYLSLNALAQYVYEIRRPHVKTSSFDALQIVGANPKQAINYIVTKYDMSRQKSTDTEDTPVILPFEIEEYVRGRDVSPEVNGFLDDIVSGIFCIDKIGAAKTYEASISTESLYNELYAVRGVFGLTAKQIYEQLRNLTPGSQTTVFSDGNTQHVMNVSESQMSVNGYKQDVQSYDIKCADECTFFTYVTLVAREVGVETCRRHVGIEFLMAVRGKKVVQDTLAKITALYEDKVLNDILDARERAKALRLTNVFALSRFFEAALHGTITWSKQLGAGVISAPTDIANAARSNIQSRIECLPTYCDMSVNCQSAAQLSFNAYCTNAYVTPQYVIPRGNSPIREVPFYSAWVDYQRLAPDIYAQLIGLNILPTNFQAWSSRYFDDKFAACEFDEMEEPGSLIHYYRLAQEEIAAWPNDKEFTSVTHPVESMYPGIYGNSDDDINSYEPLSVPREGSPVVRLGAKRDITIEDYKDILLPSELIDTPTTYIRQFRGFTIEALMLLGIDIINKIPDLGKESLTVSESSGYIYVSDTQQTMHYSRITELNPERYPVIHLYDRTYILRSADGKLWEVRT